MNTYVYELGQRLYINLTNRCTNDCDFCIRNGNEGIGDAKLWIEREPEAEDILTQLADFKLDDYKEIVFCGFGEPMLRLEVILKVAKELKAKRPTMPLRINTNGHANLFFGEDVTPKLEGLIDVVSVSLNMPTAKEYEEICHSRYKEDAFEGLLDFAAKAQAHVPKVKLSVVDVIGEEKVRQCQELADERGIPLKVRTFIE